MIVSNDQLCLHCDRLEHRVLFMKSKKKLDHQCRAWANNGKNFKFIASNNVPIHQVHYKISGESGMQGGYLNLSEWFWCSFCLQHQRCSILLSIQHWIHPLHCSFVQVHSRFVTLYTYSWNLNKIQVKSYKRPSLRSNCAIEIEQTFCPVV